MLQNLKSDLRKFSSPAKKNVLQKFFKTGKGEYGYGDVFLGVMVPESRLIAIKYKGLSFADIKKLLASPVHEERLVALLILVHNFQIGSAQHKRQIFRYYLKNARYINNWDLVDLTASKIVGAYIFSADVGSAFGVENKKQSPILSKLANSKNLWERRIAVIATFYFIQQKSYKGFFAIAEKLLNDPHDLIHKALGWMLREVGKRDLPAEIKFLNQYHKKMPRVMLRYAIEKFPENLQKKYL